MTLEGKKPAHWARPFEVTRDDEDRAKDKGKVISVRLNEDELARLREDMDLLDTDVEASALKFFWNAGRNVIHGTVGKENIAWLASRDRVRSLKRAKKTARNVIQKEGDSVGHPSE